MQDMLNSEDLIIANTESGAIKGVFGNSVVAFSGIPYAGNAGGKYRFCPPQPIEPWEGVLSAVVDGPISPQRPSRLANVMGDFDLEYSEDCLTLKIWTSAPDSGERPVLVWIHGGAFVSGAGSLPWYDGARLARDQGIVVVGINYRLGALGFLYHPEISKGNLGLRDQIFALEWVQSHIQAFGGNKNNVTLMGQSAGAISAYALLANSHARTLFQRVILQSGRFDSFETPEAGISRACDLANIAGIEIEGLKTLPVEELLNAQSKLARKNAAFAATNIPLVPVIDGDVIPNDVHSAALKGAEGKQVMLGSTHDEMHAFFAGQLEITGATNAQIDEVFMREYGDEWVDALNYCSNRRPGASQLELLSLCLNETNFSGQTANFATQLASEGVPTWLYRFDWFGPDSPFGACHCIELPFVFNSFDKWQPPMIAGINQSEANSLARVVQKTWATFARSGDPNHEELLPWPVYDSENRPELRWDRFIEIVQRPEGLKSAN